jgi:outer membrane protein assembly factor BamA
VQAQDNWWGLRTGAVTLSVDVHEGPRWRVDEVIIDDGGVEGVTLPDVHSWAGTTWTPTLEQDIREAVRLSFYRAGYPDVGLHVDTEAGDPVAGVRSTSVVVTVVSGPLVTLGTPQFVGNRKTRESVLRRRVTAKPGEPLNPLDLEHARYRIARLGVFDSVDLRYSPPEGPVRSPVFVLKEATDYETNLLFGYGSYEQLRGGVEYRQMNIFGLAHQSRLLAIQSLKSTRAEYTYSVPELFGETIDGSAKLFGLQRQEIAFQRQEYGATFALRRPVPGIHGDASVGYTFQALRNRKNALSTLATDEKQLNVASLTFGLTTDRRDNALRPRSGYHANAEVELASPFLGGVAEYQRFELTGAYHTPWGRGRWIHVGFSHGLITTLGARNDHELPVNKRFFPGGDNSIRGYQSGEAAPRDATGGSSARSRTCS